MSAKRKGEEVSLIRKTGNARKWEDAKENLEKSFAQVEHIGQNPRQEKSYALRVKRNGEGVNHAEL